MAEVEESQSLSTFFFQELQRNLHKLPKPATVVQTKMKAKRKPKNTHFFATMKHVFKHQYHTPLDSLIQTKQIKIDKK